MDSAVLVQNTNKKMRESGIELLKILAMFGIVISHCIQTLWDSNAVINTTEYLFQLNASWDINKLSLALLQHLGAQGNIIFITCSSWFLLDCKKINKRKILYLLSDVWIISMLFYVVLCCSGLITNVPKIIKLQCFFPNIFCTYWFVTCYLIFYTFVPFLNKVIFEITQKQLLDIVILSLFLYFGISFVVDTLFPSLLIFFVVIYFTVAYVKLYLENFCKNIRANLIMLFFGIVSSITLLLFVNYIDLYHNKNMSLFKFAKNNSPFLLITSISLLNLFKSRIFYNKIINSISSLTLLIFVIHGNILLSQYFRPAVYSWARAKYGYDRIVLIVILFALFLFFCSMIVAFLYKKTLKRVLNKLFDKLYTILKKIYNIIITFFLDWT